MRAPSWRPAAVALLLAVGAASVAAAQEAPAAEIEPSRAVEASNRFGFDVYAHIAPGRGNVLCSPVSAAIALAMTAAGANGPTLTEMSRVLHLDGAPLAEAHRSFAGLLAVLNHERDGRDGLILNVADRLWGREGTPFKPSFLDVLKGEYGAPMATVDFARAPDRARAEINRWAEAETRGRVRDVLSPGSVDELTTLVLTSAIYFKGCWVERFGRDSTTRRPFFAPGGKRMVPTMKRSSSLRLARVDGLALLELPYRGGLAMMVLLPDAMDGLSAVEQRLTAEYGAWRAELKAARPGRVDVQLPRWKGTTKLSLRETLMAMGMTRAFNPGGADFTGMAGGPQILFLRQVWQQAYIAVDEDGTEAAAVTHAEVGMMHKASALPIPFHVDHPFAYLIIDQQTDVVLFMGRVMDPAAP